MTAISQQQKKFTSGNPLSVYKEYALGDRANWLDFFYYEFTQTLLANCAGLIGFAGRTFTYPYLFQACGKRPAFGRGVILRGGKYITLGHKVLVDDYAVLDARGEQSSIVLGDQVSLGRGSALVAKDAQINIANGVNIGTGCRIASQSKISIGESTLIAAYAYVGPGNHQHGDQSQSLIERPMQIKGGVEIGKNVWIGARATIMDGVKIGDGAVIGAHAYVNIDVPAGRTAVGTPARLL